MPNASEFSTQKFASDDAPSSSERGNSVQVTLKAENALDTHVGSVSPVDRLVSNSMFQPRSAALIVGLVMVIITVWLTTVVEAKGSTQIVAVAACCFLVGITWVLNQTQRWEHAQIAYGKVCEIAEESFNKHIKLLDESQRTSAVISHMTDGVVLLSPNNEILLINDAARGLLAIDDEQAFQGRRLAELIRVPQIVHATSEARNTGHDQSLAVEIVHGAKVSPVSVRIGRIMDSSTPHLLVVLHDETDAQRVEAMRREFIANVSHELKTPLAAIKGYAETVELAIDDDPDSAKHFLSQIGTQCNRLEDLIADMMRLARAQTGKETLDIKVVDWRDVIRSALETFSPVAKAKGVELSADDFESPVQVWADEEAMLTIIQNLVSNAIRHTESGGHVRIGCRSMDAGWVLAVQDDGAGIAPEFQERIFERFYRVNKNRRSADGGTGIGLAIVKNLTRSMGGTVKVVSSPGEGATFEVWLPVPQ